MDTDIVRPLSFDRQYGAGLGRGLVLGGGGVFLIAWQTGYLARAVGAGIDLRAADRIVGTSAGSLVGAMLGCGRISLMDRAADLLVRAPFLVSFLAPADLAPSQQRAFELMWKTPDNDPESVRAIGHAALAAATPSARTMRRNVGLLVDYARWPSHSLWVTAVDAYTGERVVITDQTGVPTRRAVAASCALPGLYPPQIVADRPCMDGGMSGTATNSDLVAGADRAIVLSLARGDRAMPEAMGTASTDHLLRELDALRAGGTRVFHRWAPMRPDLDLMSPATMEEGLQAGRQAAEADLDELRELWGDGATST